jgi:putative endonuclease
MWFIYILQCSDGSFYTGSTNNLEKRFSDHLSGRGGKYTRSHKPQRIVYKEELQTKSDALRREAEIKKLSRLQKEALM